MTEASRVSSTAERWFESTIAEIEDFQNPKQEWRRLFAELLGTFFLVLVAAGGGMMGQAFPNTISRTAAVVAPALMVMAVILFMGKVSGAHLNPAVSLAFALRGDFPWRRVPGYIVVQLIGATLAALFLRAVIDVSASYGSNYPASGYSAGAAFWMELILTLGLVSVIRKDAAFRRPEHSGDLRRCIRRWRWLSIAAGRTGGGARSQGTFDGTRARTFGPDLVGRDWTSYWVYVAGPLAGAALAVAFFAFLSFGAREAGVSPRASRSRSGGISSTTEDRPT